MKVALIYTSTTPELIELVEKEVKSQLPSETSIISFQSPEILRSIREAGYVTAEAAAALVTLFMRAVQEGADAMLNICSSVGEVADAIQPLAKYLGIPIVRIDEEMCREAIKSGKKIAVMATLPTTLEPTKGTLLRVAREMDCSVELVDCLVEGAFGINKDGFAKKMLEYAENVIDQADVILLAQGSMAYCQKVLSDAYKMPVFSSPGYGAKALRKALVEKGLIE